ncbi:unnamed protein product [Gadus morhua 'NCC']
MEKNLKPDRFLRCVSDGESKRRGNFYFPATGPQSPVNVRLCGQTAPGIQRTHSAPDNEIAVSRPRCVDLCLILGALTLHACTPEPTAASTLRRAPWSRVYIIDLREFFPSEDSARVLLLEADGQTLLVGMDFLFTASAN